MLRSALLYLSNQPRVLKVRSNENCAVQIGIIQNRVTDTRAIHVRA